MTDYRKLTYTDAKIQVDSAIRDGNGVKIDTNYQRKPTVYERTTNSSTSTICTLIQFNASDYKANGYLAHFRFRVRSKLQDAYPSDNEFIINYSYRNADIICTNSKWTTTNDIVQTIYTYYPSTDAYLDTGNYFIAFKTDRASTNFIVEMIEADVPYTVPATMSASTTTNLTYKNLTPGSYGSGHPLMWTGSAEGNIEGHATSSSSSSLTYKVRDQYSYYTGDADSYKLMAVDHTGVAYKINTSTKKFPLPINMYWGVGYISGVIADGDNFASDLNVSRLTNSSDNNFSMPTLTTSDGGKTLYVRGSLDADGYFVCDGNVTLSMGAGYTYIPFGTLSPRLSGLALQVPTKFSLNVISAPAYTFDASGKLTHINGKPVVGGNMKYTDQSLSFTSNTDTYSTDYPYRATLTSPGTTASSYASVVYSANQVSSGNFAPFCRTDDGVVYLYSKVSGTYTIPTISVGVDSTDYTRQPISADIVARTLTLVSSSNTEVAGYPYKYSFPCAGASAQSTADVTFGSVDATSGAWASICDTGANVIYIYARSAQTSCSAGYQLYYSDTSITLAPSGTTGSDTRPLKLVGGQLEAVSTDLTPNTSSVTSVSIIYTNGFSTSYGSITARKFGKIVHVYFDCLAPTSTGSKIICRLPSDYRPSSNMYSVPGLVNTIGTNFPHMNVYTDGGIEASFSTTNGYYGAMMFIQ